MASPDKFARRLDRIEGDLRDVATKPRLARSSVDGGAIELRDLYGDTVGFVGEQFDGTVTMAAVGGLTPPSPLMPLIEAVSGGLRIYWDGTFASGETTPMNFRRVTFHAVTDVALFDALDPAQICGEITIATGGEIFAALPPVEHFIFAVSWSDAGKFSVESDPAFGTPLSLVDDVAWQDHEAALTDLNQVQLPALQSDLDGVVILTDGWRVTGQTTIDGGKIAADSVASAQIAAGAIIAEKVGAGAIIAEKIGAGAIIAGKIAVDAVTSGTIAADAITAKHTITGATIQTHPSPSTGLKIVGNVLTSYDGSGVARFIANGNDGTVTVVGGSITGGTFKTATSGKRTEINTDSADSSRVLFYSGLAEEYTPSSITSTSTKTDANNIQTGVTLQAGTVTGSTGSASIVIGAGKGMTGALPATRVQINAYNDSVNPAIVSIGAGPSGLEISDPAGVGNDFAKLTGTEVLIESVTKPFKVYAGGTIAAPGTKVSTFEINGDLSIPGRLISALDDTGWRVVGDPGQPGFTSNWVNFGGGHVPARFKKVGGIVYVQGLIRLGTFGSTAFQLPVGYRPSHTIMNTQIEGTNAAGRMDITSLGQIVPTSGNGSFFSVTFAFPADQ